MKFIKTIFIISISSTILLGVYFQVVSEKYKQKQNVKYGIVDGRQRLHYTPVAIYFIFRDDNCKHSILLPYINKGLKEFVSGCIYDEYIAYCYFSEQEIEKYLSEIPK